MKAIVVNETGSAEILSYEDAPMPTPAAGEVRLKVAAAGLNFIDTYQRSGLYTTPLPFILGREGAGVVDAVGEGVTTLKEGDRVAFAFGTGAYAEYCCVSAESLVIVPDDVDLELAAAVMLQGTTAHYLAYSTYPLKEGDTCLVHAAAGGVGTLLVQVAKMCGATVIGTVSTQEKADLATSLGADHIIRYTEQDFAEETMRITNGAGCEVVYDSVGKTTFDKSLSVLKARGYLALYGQSSGSVPDFDLQRLGAGGGSLFITRPSLGNYIATHEELTERCNDLFGWIGSGKLQVRIDQKFALSDAAAAHQYLEGRKTKGKVILIP